jgi:hypothetical protein
MAFKSSEKFQKPFIGFGLIEIEASLDIVNVTSFR